MRVRSAEYGNRRQKTRWARRPGLVVLTVLGFVLVGSAPCVGVAQEVYEEPGFNDAEFYEPPVVRQAASEVLSGPEFRDLPPLDLGVEGKKAEPLKPKSEERETEEIRVRTPSAGSSFISGLFGGMITFVAAAAIAVVVAVIVALIVIGIRRWERERTPDTRSDADAATDEDVENVLTPGEKPADAWLAAAREAAAAGRFDEALALLLLGAMSHAERAGLIRPRRGLTYRDYLRAVPRHSAWHPTLAGLVNAYAPVGFGRREATAAAFDAAIGPYEQALAVEPTPAMRASSDDGAGQ